MDMQPIEPTQALTATLTAQEWNHVMAAVDNLPHRIARPLFDKLGQQLQMAQASALALDRLRTQQQSQPQELPPGVNRHRGNEVGRNEMGLDRLHAEP